MELIAELNKILLSFKLNAKEDVLVWKPGLEPYSASNGLKYINSSLEEEPKSWFFIWNLKYHLKQLYFCGRFIGEFYQLNFSYLKELVGI